MIPFNNLRLQHDLLRDDLNAAIERVMNSGQFVLGEEVAALENEFAAYCEADFGIAVNSGTSALHLALLAAGVGPGDEVVTVPFTFVATVAAIGYVGARAVLVDVHPESLTMDAELLEAAITARTKAVIPVHLHGQPADMQPILAVARRHGLTVIEDAAQAHGARWEGRRVGSIGHLGCFSFYPGKNLGACGEGGMVVTNNADHAKAIRLLRDWGQDRKYHHALRGFNFRMDGLQGAILREKLRHLDRWNEARRARASTYDKLLAGADVRLPSTMPFAEHVFHVYAIRHGQRDALQRALSDRAIQTGIHYPIPVHLQPAFADLGYQAGDFPVAEAAASQTLSLPLFPEITEDMQRQVADAIVQSTADLRPLALPVAES